MPLRTLFSHIQQYKIAMPDLPVLILKAVNTEMNRKVLIKHLLKMSETIYNIIAGSFGN